MRVQYFTMRGLCLTVSDTCIFITVARSLSMWKRGRSIGGRLYPLAYKQTPQGLSPWCRVLRAGCNAQSVSSWKIRQSKFRFRAVIIFCSPLNPDCLWGPSGLIFHSYQTTFLRKWPGTEDDYLHEVPSVQIDSKLLSEFPRFIIFKTKTLEYNCLSNTKA